MRDKRGINTTGCSLRRIQTAKLLTQINTRQSSVCVCVRACVRACACVFVYVSACVFVCVRAHVQTRVFVHPSITITEIKRAQSFVRVSVCCMRYATHRTFFVINIL